MVLQTVVVVVVLQTTQEVVVLQTTQDQVAELPMETTTGRILSQEQELATPQEQDV